ncbi:MAG: 3'-5' exonuclease [Candidatus Pacebacteria bacterium]|nr:3'-5' exonuclease [Candidatus Paceibacterota bacterium]
MKKLIFLDTETTGNDLKEDRLCQVAYKIDGDMTAKNFKPTIPISIKAMSVTNITNKIVENEEAFQGSNFAKELQDLLNENILVAHNASFDIAMLENEGLKVPNYICTLKLSRYLDDKAEIPEHNLQFLRYYYDVDPNLTDGHSLDVIAHSADGDVLVLEAIYKYIHNLAKEKSNTEADEDILNRMMEISKKPSLIRRFSFGKHINKLVEDVVQEDKGYLEWFLKTKEEEGTDEDWIYTLKYFLNIK